MWLRCTLIAVAVLLASSAGAAPAGCTALTDALRDEQPPPQAVGFDRAGLDLATLMLSDDRRALHVAVRVRDLRRPVVPVGQGLTYRVYWRTGGADQTREYRLDASLDGSSQAFTLGYVTGEAPDDRGGEVVTQVGGPLEGRVDEAADLVRVSVPLDLMAGFLPPAPRGVFEDVAVGAFHRTGNPSVSQEGSTLVGQSGYGKIADGAVATAPYRLGSCRR